MFFIEWLNCYMLFDNNNSNNNNNNNNNKNNNNHQHHHHNHYNHYNYYHETMFKVYFRLQMYFLTLHYCEGPQGMNVVYIWVSLMR